MPKVKISFEMDLPDNEIEDTLTAWREYAPVVNGERTLKTWAEFVGECIREQWDGVGEGEIWTSTVSISVE